MKVLPQKDYQIQKILCPCKLHMYVHTKTYKELQNKDQQLLYSTKNTANDTNEYILKALTFAQEV